MSETIFLPQLVEKISASKGVSRQIIALAGPPAVGKSTTAQWIVDRLNGIEPGSAALLPMDGYHYDDLVLVPRGLRPRKGSPNTFDVGGLRHMLMRLRENAEEEIAVPIFDRSIEIARAGAAMIARSVRHVIVEGNYLLLNEAPWTTLKPFFDISVLITASEATLRRRLRERWVGYGLNEKQIRQKLDENDMPNGLLILNHSQPGDFTIDSDEAVLGD